MTIKIQIKQVYGVDTVYPACPLAVQFAALCGTKTLTAEKLRMIRAMGVEIAVEAPAVSFA